MLLGQSRALADWTDCFQSGPAPKGGPRYAQWCVEGETSKTLASGIPFLGSPLRYYAHKFSLFLVKDVLFTHAMCYKANHKQVFCFQRAPLLKL